MSDRQRPGPPRTADERASLTGFLQYQRETLAMKCAGLTTDQLRRRSIPPSGLSLLGLVRHAATVERSWFRLVWDGEEVRPRWPGRVDGVFAEFAVETADPEEAFTQWELECARSREIVARAGSLDTTVRWGEEVYSLRYVLLHMIEEYARHNGHADLLRERIDGAAGD